MVPHADWLRMLAANRRRAREAAGFTEADTADAMGIDVLEVLRIEAGICPVSEDTEAAWFLAHGFDVIRWWDLVGE